MSMRAKILLAEAATHHPDGTVSILRSGITHIRGSGPPYRFKGCLVIRIEGELSDKGMHGFELHCMDEDGGEVLPPLKGQFEVPKGGGVNGLILGLAVAFKKIGRYVFSLRVDNVGLDTWTVSVVQQQKGSKS